MPEKDIEKSLSVFHETDGWYYYDWAGVPYGPFPDLNAAWDALDDSLHCQYAEDE